MEVNTNRDFHRQLFIRNIIVFRQYLLRKHGRALENLRPVRLNELEICIRLNPKYLHDQCVSLPANEMVGVRRYTRRIQPHLIGSRIDKFP